MAKRQVKCLVHKISDRVKDCCMNGGRVGRGKDSGQRAGGGGERWVQDYSWLNLGFKIIWRYFRVWFI